jgi:hypothetical protein
MKFADGTKDTGSAEVYPSHAATFIRYHLRNRETVLDIK